MKSALPAPSFAMKAPVASGCPNHIDGGKPILALGAYIRPSFNRQPTTPTAVFGSLAHSGTVLTRAGNFVGSPPGAAPSAKPQKSGSRLTRVGRPVSAIFLYINLTCDQ
jgi:hypothetical protein